MQDEKTLWKGVLARYPRSHRALGNLANAYLVEKKFAEAAPYYQKIIEILPGHAMTYANIGLIYASGISPLRDLEKAKFFLNKALDLDPQIADAWQFLGLIVLEQGQVDQAEAHFRKAIEVNPRHLGAYNQLCALMIDEKRWEEARVLLDISRSLLPTHPMVIENATRLSTLR